MQRTKLPLVIIVLLALSGGILHAQSRLSVTPPWRTGDNPLEESLSLTVSDTLKLEFGGNPRFRLVDTAQFPASEGEMILYAREQGLDYVIFGRIDTVGGKIRLNISLYDHKNRSVSVNRTVAVPRIKDIFQVTDRMFALLMADIEPKGPDAQNQGIIDPSLLFAGGKGTEASPFKISSASNLINIDLYPDSVYTLTRDLDLTGIQWVPVSGFGGTFRGNGHTIKGLTISSGLYENNGLFGVIAEKGSVSDLTLTGVSIKGKAGSGAIAGYNLGRINHCTALGSVDGTFFVGGIAGHNNGTISDCTFTGAIISRLTNTGGITGENQDRGTLTRCRFSGTVANDGRIDRRDDYPDWVLTYPGNSMGGVSGTNYGTVSECSAEGDLTCIKDTCGGIVGYNLGRITDSRFSGNITLRGVMGGLIAGFNSRGTIRFCFGEGKLVCRELGGGIVGSNLGDLTDCVVYKPVVLGDNSAPGIKADRIDRAKRFYVILNPDHLTDPTRKEYTDWDFTAKWIMTEAGPRLRFEN